MGYPQANPGFTQVLLAPSLTSVVMTGRDGVTTVRARPRRAQDREILRLAVPAFLALVAEPLFLLADSAIVGHLGTPQLAALGIASAVLGTLVSLCIFLAYGTTASVARQVGAGNTRAALAQGIDGLWLADADRRAGHASPCCR